MTKPKPVFYIDDVDVYYEDEDKDVLFWDSDELPDQVLGEPCEYRRIRGVFSQPRGPINADYLRASIEAQDGGVLMQPLDAIQAICHSRRHIVIDVTDDGVMVAPQLLALARQAAGLLKTTATGNFGLKLKRARLELNRERKVSELLMQALMGVLGHAWVDDECHAALVTEAAQVIGNAKLIGNENQ